MRIPTGRVAAWSTNLRAAHPNTQFDFWLGDWEVFDETGARQGTNHIEAILGGCALRESWVGESGSIGHSFNSYDRQTGRWH